jgi:hypothetical protein
MSTKEEYIASGGRDTMYPSEVLPEPPVGYFWKIMTMNGKIMCYKLFEKPKVSGCNCTKR